MVPARDIIRPVLPIREKYGTGFAMIGLLMVYQNLLNPPVLPWIPQPPAVGSAFPNTAFPGRVWRTVLKSETPAAYTSLRFAG